ncbi:MAG: hypothetical protein AAB074_03505 [Planctomycetota bacterium]
MSLQFPCPCGRLLQVSEDLGGKRVRCPSCSRIVWAPAAPESVPEARLVDGPATPKIEPVAAKVGTPEPPMARVAAAEAPSPVGHAGGACATKHDCGAVGGFILSLGSLVFGVVAFPLLVISGPVGGSIGALVSCSALRRIRAGKGNPASEGLARAGIAIGVGQSLLGLLLIAALGVAGFKDGNGCCFKKVRHNRMQQSTISAPEVKTPVKVEQKEKEVVETEAEVVEEK